MVPASLTALTTITAARMKYLFPTVWSALLMVALAGCHALPKADTQQAAGPGANGMVGGGCDGCELMYMGMPASINAVDTSAGWHEPGQKLLVTGTVLQPDGRTPAPNVIIYYWQTDQNGAYSPVAGLDKRVREHGHIRGWVKTGADGRYTLYTNRPGPYPGRDSPAHIHPSVKEPGIDPEYYIDDFVFDDDRLLTGAKRKALPNRGGSGILRVLHQGDLQVAERNIVLGLNIPNYPVKGSSEKQSGRAIGEDSPSFMPTHAWGPDKGTRNCPVCKYGRYHGILYFVGRHPDWAEIRQWLTVLEQVSNSRDKYLKAYFVYGNEQGFSKEARKKELGQLGRELGLKKVALTFVPSLSDTASEADLNQINPDVQNTFVIYKNRNIVDKYIDLKPTPENIRLLSATLDKTQGAFFDLPEPEHE